MNKTTITRRFQFCSGHRVYGHESKCANLHGHNYLLFVTAEAPELDSLGRIIDFSVIKDRIGSWIDGAWDHAFLYYEKDLECKWLFMQTEQFSFNKSYQCTFNPTAEEMAKFLLTSVCPEVMDGTGVTVTKVTLWETENCFAEVSL